MKETFDSTSFRATASRLPEAIVTADPKGRILWANRGFKSLCGYPLREIKGKKPGDFLQGPNTDPRTVEMMREALGRRQYFKTEIINYHKKGNAYWAEISVTPCFDSEGNLEGFVSVARDITRKQIKLMQMEQDLISMYSALIKECAEGSENTSVSESVMPLQKDPFLDRLRPRENVSNS